MMGQLCNVGGCDRAVHCKGMCDKHYRRVLRHGDPLIARRTRPSARRIWLLDHVNYEGNDCLTWPFALRYDGYAKLDNTNASHIMCELVNGPPPPGHQTAHSCGNGHLACINPRHLRWATPVENNADKVLHGTVQRGEKNPKAKLNAASIICIRRLHEMGVTQKLIAIAFGVTATNVSGILKGYNWTHISEEIDYVKSCW